MTSAKPYSEACARNQAPILEVLRMAFADRGHVLEIGSGSGQHAVYLGRHLPYLTWQTSDIPENHDGIRAWLEDARLSNVLPPLALDVNGPWPARRYDAIFTANTLHIVSWSEVERMFAGIARSLEDNGVLAVYGPFNYRGCHTSESNANFDAWLRARNPASGIRGFEDVDALAHSHGFELQDDIAMPANNRTLVWRRLIEYRPGPAYSGGN